jgi:hypothetical protein
MTKSTKKVIAPISTTTKRKVKDATKTLTFRITYSHVARAKCSNPNECVVAQGLKDLFGDLFEEVYVGGSIIKLVTKTEVIRYATPKALREALIAFDEKKGWRLPPGEYTIRPPYRTNRLGGGGRGSRWDKKTSGNGKPGRTVFMGKKLPTRHVVRVESLTSI